MAAGNIAQTLRQSEPMKTLSTFTIGVTYLNIVGLRQACQSRIDVLAPVITFKTLAPFGHKHHCNKIREKKLSEINVVKSLF